MDFDHGLGVPLAIKPQGAVDLSSSGVARAGSGRLDIPLLGRQPVLHLQRGIAHLRRNRGEHSLDRPAAALIPMVPVLLRDRE